MKSIIPLFLALLVFSDKSYADDFVPNYRNTDFYYHDNSDLPQRLVLTPKFAVFFKDDFPSKKNADYFVLFNENIAKINNVRFNEKNECFVVHFKIESTDSNLSFQSKLVEKLNSANNLARSVAIVYPVLKVDGLEVIFTNEILLRVADAIDKSTLRNYLDNASANGLGKFTVGTLKDHSASPRHFELEIDELRWPPNLLVLANLLNEQRWSKQSRVVFKNLSYPLDISFYVTPDGSPTLGEQRYLVMVAVSKPDIEIEQNMLPSLGLGEFYVKEDLVNVFFSAKEAEIIIEKDNFRKTTTIKWPFHIYASGVYYFSDIEIPYVNKKTDKKSSINVSPGQVKINSIIYGSDISDIQPLRRYYWQLLASGKKLDFKKFTVYWGVTCIVTAMIICFALGVYCCKVIIGFEKEGDEVGITQKSLELKKRALKLAGVSDYQAVELLLRDLMYYAFDLPYNVQEEDLDSSKESVILADCLRELRNRHRENYSPSSEVLENLRSKLESTADVVLNKNKEEENGD